MFPRILNYSPINFMALDFDDLTLSDFQNKTMTIKLKKTIKPSYALG